MSDAAPFANSALYDMVLTHSEDAVLAALASAAHATQCDGERIN